MTPLFDVGLQPLRPEIPFTNQFPFFNWYYPLDDEDSCGATAEEVCSAITSAHGRRALYIHIPFCETICSFCPFTRAGFSSFDEVEDYVSALILEIRLKSASFGRLPVTCIFVGGGSPSVLTAEQFHRLGEALHQSFDTSRLMEFSVEVEAKSLTLPKVLAMCDIGVSRASFGVQSFDAVARNLFTLTASVNHIRDAAALLREHIPCTNVDMIFGYPGQTALSLDSDIDAACSLETTSVDFYPLNNLAAQPRLHRLAERERLAPASARTRLEMRRRIDQIVRSRSYVRINGYGYSSSTQVYKVTNRPEAMSSRKFLYHDILYGHSTDSVLGFGAAAISMVPGYNIHNTPSRDEYVHRLNSSRSIACRAFNVGPCHEKGVIYFPYRGNLEKKHVDWAIMPEGVERAFIELRDAGLLRDNGEEFVLTDTGWLFYVNMMYYLTPPQGKRWLTDRIHMRASGRAIEDTAL